MKRFNRTLAAVMAFSMLVSVTACTVRSSAEREKNPEPSKPEYSEPFNTPVPSTPGSLIEPDDQITDFSMFSVYVGISKDKGNEIKELIAEKTGVRVEETWLSQYGMTTDEAVDSIIASGNYPDFVDCGDRNIDLYKNGCLVAWDDYLEMYPNLKEFYSDEEWDTFRQDDGHIYWANVLGNYYGKNTAPMHTDMAFWIQVRVLEWAGYPKIETLDDYFDLLERYYEANPTMPDGQEIIPYTCICESWRIFGLDGAPTLLDGYTDNHCVNVDTTNGMNKPAAIDNNTTDTAKAYFRKLNEEYQKGIVDPEFEVQTYDEYILKISSGKVLGMFDYYWDFGYSTEFRYETVGRTGQTLSELGCDYVPLGLVAERGMEQSYHVYNELSDTSSGIAVTVSCVDVDLAFSFLNDLLDQEIHDLRFWGIEGVDYLIDEYGLYYRTEEMRIAWEDPEYLTRHVCEYSMMPQWKGMSRDGINRMMPSEQPSEFQAGLPKPVVTCFKAYGVENYVEFLGSARKDPGPWYPLWTWSNMLSTDTPEGWAWYLMGECKHKWLPEVVMAGDFDETWDEYMAEYQECDPDVFINASQSEVNARLGI